VVDALFHLRSPRGDCGGVRRQDSFLENLQHAGLKNKGGGNKSVRALAEVLMNCALGIENGNRTNRGLGDLFSRRQGVRREGKKREKN